MLLLRVIPGASNGFVGLRGRRMKGRLPTYCKAVGRGPNASPLGVENGSPVEITSSHQTTVFPSASRKDEDAVVSEVPGIDICFDGSESARTSHKTGRPTDLATTCLISSRNLNAPAYGVS